MLMVSIYCIGLGLGIWLAGCLHLGSFSQGKYVMGERSMKSGLSRVGVGDRFSARRRSVLEYRDADVAAGVLRRSARASFDIRRRQQQQQPARTLDAVAMTSRQVPGR